MDGMSEAFALRTLRSSYWLVMQVVLDRTAEAETSSGIIAGHEARHVARTILVTAGGDTFPAAAHRLEAGSANGAEETSVPCLEEVELEADVGAETLVHPALRQEFFLVRVDDPEGNGDVAELLGDRQNRDEAPVRRFVRGRFPPDRAVDASAGRSSSIDGEQPAIVQTRRPPGTV